MTINENSKFDGSVTTKIFQNDHPTKESSTSTSSELDTKKPSALIDSATQPSQSPAMDRLPQNVVDYWQRALSGCENIPFPALPSTVQQPLPDQAMEHHLLRPQTESQGIDASTVIQAAWALVAGQISDSNDVVFGVTLSSESASAQTAADVLPLRIKLAKDQKVADYLKEVQQQKMDMIPFENIGLRNIPEICSEGRRVCMFQTLLEIQHQNELEKRDSPKQESIKDYALVLKFSLGTSHHTVVAHFDSRVIKSWLVKKLLERLERVVCHIDTKTPGKKIADIKMITPQDVQQIWEWNHDVPATVERSISEIIQERVQSQPDAPALFAWDGELTYSELDRLTTMLASRLVDLGVGPEVFVPLCFEKSMWTMVAILGVLKAGGAFVLLDTSLPEQRLQDIVQQVGANLALSSSPNRGLCAKLVKEAITVNSDLFTGFHDNNQPIRTLSKPAPSSAAYAIFTSGSTGTPKGVIIPNSNMASAMRQADRLGCNGDSRVYDFVSYSFGLSILIALPTLAAGGCLCVPRDQDRKSNLAGSINALKANVVWLTPSIAATLSPQNVPGLRMMGFGGEAVRVQDVLPWWGHVDVRNGYGASECTTLIALNSDPSVPEDVCQIGTGAGVVHWVVDPENHNILIPVGSVGELLVEGPHIGRGYIHDPVKTAASFIEDPVWLLEGSPDRPGRHARIYKTGDLVRYNESGSLSYIGRKDAQVKIRGQRVELGEVEFHLQQCMPDWAAQVVAEVIVPQGGSDPAIAAFFLAQKSIIQASSSKAGLPRAMPVPIPRDIEDTLAKYLPSYMIPTAFFSLWELPMTATGKTNRRQLREIGGTFSAQQLAEVQTAGQGLKRQPITQIEKKIQKIWANVLNINIYMIGLDDSFFKLGGNSVAAIKVVGEARNIGLQLQVTDIFRQSTLYCVAAQALSVESSFEDIAPFSLLGDNPNLTSLLRDISSQYQIDSTKIQDAYPCSPLQEGLILLTSKRPGDYIMQFVIDLSPDVDLTSLRKAWQDAVFAISLLRTIIIQHDEFGLLQVVLDEEIEWIEATGLEEYIRTDRERNMGLNQPLARYAFVNDDEGACSSFVWTVHHALYDGWSIPLVFDAVNRAYQGKALDPGPQFQSFIKHIKDQDMEKLADYWRQTLADCEPVPFPALPPSIEQPIADGAIEYQLPKPQIQSLDITESSILRAAWAIVVSQMTNSKDVVFGITVSGRSAPVANMDKITGPTIATVPLRIKLASDQKVLDFMNQVQQQAIDMIPFEQVGLQNIVKICPEGQQASKFQTLLLVQPRERTTLQDTIGKLRYGDDQEEWFNTYGLTLEVYLNDENILAKAFFDTRVIQSHLVYQLLQRLDHVMQQLDHACPGQLLKEVEVLTPQDLKQIWEWNSAVPVRIDQCLPDTIKEHARVQPNAPAICAWDGKLTYQELDQLAMKLASRLVSSYGVGPGVIVPLCFEKSMWTTVAVLGVLKTGAAFVLLDHAIPERRFQSIVRQVEAILVLSSVSNQTLSLQLCNNVAAINSDFFSDLGDEKEQLPVITASSLMYVIFTSGSTGTPKGVKISHGNWASAQHHQSADRGFTPQSRVYDFASYSFDACLGNLFHTLGSGACLCVPNDQDRKEKLAESIVSLQADVVELTPSLSRILDPSDVPQLKTLIFGGEALRLKDVMRWWGKVQIFNTYGPSECTPDSVINKTASSPEEATELGQGYGAVAWVVDPEDHDCLLPPGGIGEMLLEGPIVGLGYLNDPEKTVAAYVEDPTWLTRGAPGRPGRRGRLYKTGDLVQYNKDGSLKYIGRKDDQVKINGQRIELKEVEHWVHDCMPQAKQVVAEVITPQGKKTSSTLVVFLELDIDMTEIDSEPAPVKVVPVSADIEDKLTKHLPSYMLPTIFFAMRQLPIGATGKMSRQQLRKIGGMYSAQRLAEMRTSARGPKRQPTSEIELQLQNIWAHVLDIEVETIGIDDSFFQLGGDSLAAMKVAGEARKLGLELTAADIFRYRRLHDIANQQRLATDNAPQSITRFDRSALVEQSFAQERLWFLEQLHPGLTWYHMASAMRIRGQLQLHALDTAFNALENRHESLRTTFSSQDGVSMQTVHPFQPKKLKVLDYSPHDERGFSEALEEEQRTPFNLETEPAWRVAVFRLKEDDYILSIVMHHIISDGWSVDILRTELAGFYSAALHGRDPLLQIDPLPIQYGDFSIWQKQKEQADEQERQLQYWLKELETARPAELLCDKPRPATLSGNSDLENIRIEGELFKKLQRFCKQLDVTPFIALLAAFRATHYRVTGQSDVTIGSPNANRDRWELKDLVGFFVNIQCFRLRIDNESFKELVQQVEISATASIANQDVPFERIVASLQKDRDLARNPLVQVMFAVHSQLNLDKFKFEGVEVETIPFPSASRFDLEFHLYQENEAFSGGIVYSTDLYNPNTITNFLSLFSKILQEGLREPETAIASLPLLADADYSALNEMGLIQIHKTDYPRDSNVVDVFRQQVDAFPDRLAVKDSYTQLTYAELDQKSDILAQWLSERSFPAETLVGVFASRSCETIVAILGILKANLAYLPFDVKIPMSRMETVLSSIPNNTLVLVGSHVQPHALQLNNVELVLIENTLKDNSRISPRATAAPSPASLAYVMFTSGSTGQPKGVMIEHRNILRLAKQCNMAQHLPCNAIMGHISNIAFDASTWEIYAALLNGGTLICIDTMELLDYKAVAETFGTERIQVVFITPALLKQYLLACPEILRNLEAIVVGGDRLDPQDICTMRKLIGGKILNGYGPTENTSFSTFYNLEDERCTNGVPIGRALSNSGAYVMDSQQRLVPLGVVGELVVTGDGLARGYTDPQRNIDRFITITIADQKIRAYRTGDYVRYRTDGQLEIFGRMDGQIKIRGQRVELGEIEHVLRSHSSVNDAVTVLRQEDGQEAQLVSFVTVSEGNGQNKDEVNQQSFGESKHHDAWEERFDADIYVPMDDVQAERIGRDFIGWTSMYDGRDIDKGEMNEWLEDTMKDIHNGGQAGKVLEVGTGSGMILFNLSGLQSYIGLEPTERAVEFVTQTSESIPTLAGKVRMFKTTAANVSRLKGPISANLVVINSVAQYFPSQDYIFRLVQDLLHISGVRTIYFGDIRSFALYKQFLVTRSLRIAEGNASRGDIQRMIEDMEQVELEFLTDPAFFTALKNRLPHLVEHVEILPKKMKSTNELSCYRYAAVIHAKSQGMQKHEIHEIDQNAWIDFIGQRLDRESLLHLLQDSPNSSTVAFSNIPYKKTIFERCVVDLLEDETKESLDQRDWLSHARQKARDFPSLSALDLVELAQQAGYRVEISWARQYTHRGGFDAVFHHYESEGRKRVLFNFPTDYKERPPNAVISSRPLRQQMMQKIRQELEKMLQAQLPSYMIPQLITIIDTIPINANGKIDRQALVKRIQKQTAGRGPVRQPISEAERQIQRIWAEVLSVDPANIGLEANFFRLGGNSIAAMKVVAEACKIGLQLVVADVFRYPQLDNLAKQTLSPGADSTRAIPQTQLSGPVEQSFAQKRLWFMEELYPGLTWFLVPCAMRLRGPLQLDALNAAFLALESRHATLRTTFSTNSNIHQQEIHPFRAKYLNVIDIAEDGLTEALDRSQNSPFDLRKEPGWRVSVYRLSKEDNVLSVVMHHIISDGWSIDILCRELAAFYSAAVRGEDPLSTMQPLPIQYYDYSIWQNGNDQAEEYQRQLSYWAKQLETSRPAELLCDKTRPATLSGQAGELQYRIEGPRYEKLQQFCQTYGVTPFVALLSAFRATHFRLTGQSDATLGSLNANRSRWELKDIIGFFVNMQCLRIKVEDETTFEELVQQVYLTNTKALANQDVPFESIVSKLQKDRDLSRNPLAQIVFAVHSQLDLGKLTLEGVEMEILQETTTSRFDLEFHFYPERNGGFRGVIFYSTDLYAEETICNMLSVFQSILDGSLDEPNAVISSMPLLTSNDYATLDNMGLIQIDRRAYPRESSIVDLFRQQASEFPSRIAVKDALTELTYTQLDILSDMLAQWLARRSFAPETLVGVFADRSCQAVVAFLGVLKASLAYLPFDVKIPGGRMENILSSIPGHRIILTGAGTRPPAIQLEDVEFIRIEEILDKNSQNHTALEQPLIAIAPSADNLAYVTFTSGSTGQPKGVMVEHRGIVRLVKQSNIAQHLSSAPITAHITSIAFDVAAWEIYSTLLNGGKLICIDYATLLDYSAMGTAFTHEKIQTAMFTPVLLKQLLLESPATIGLLDSLYVAGDRADAQDLFTGRGLIKGDIINAYGPTENAVISTLYSLQKDEQCVNGVPIGKSISNSGAYVMDKMQRIVPLGVVGELVVTGDGLARGYTDPQRDIDRFVTVDIGGKEHKAYRTGDYVRWRPVDGQIEFFGRIDGQVKIRGHRVELGEIESALRTHESVTDSVVVLQQGDDQEPQLAGFITIGENNGQNKTKLEKESDDVNKSNDTNSRPLREEIIRQDLHKMLQSQFPSYMIPQLITVLDTIPVNANGKVDRVALAKRIQSRRAERKISQQPTTEIEQTMQMIWAQVLEIDAATIGLDDSFFLLGGNSIMAMNVVARARKVAFNLSVADIFRHDTIAKLTSLKSLKAKQVDQGFLQHIVDSATKTALLQEVESLGIDVSAREIEDILPLTNFQEECVVRGIKSEQICNYFYLDLGDHVDLPRLEKSCNMATERFPLFRSCFLHLSGKFWQVILHQLNGPLLYTVDVNEDLNQSFHNFCARDTRELAPTQPPLAFMLLKHQTQGNRFVIRMSHAQYDGICLPLIFESLIAGYNETPLPDMADFSLFISYAHLRRDESIKYWRELLRGSSPATIQSIQSKFRPQGLLKSLPKGTLTQAETNLPQLRAKTTSATLVNIAWAILLSRLTGQSDVVYGHLVAGRNSSIRDVGHIVGPCVNIVPVRARVPSVLCASELVSSVQEQFIALGEADSMGFQDIIEQCTDWPVTQNFDFVIQHQNVDEHPEFEISGAKCELQYWLNPEQVAPWRVYMISYPKGDRLRISLATSTDIMTEEVANGLLDGLMKIIEKLAYCLDVSSPFLMEEVNLEL